MKPGNPSRLYGKLKQTPIVGFVSCLGEAPARAEFLLWGYVWAGFPKDRGLSGLEGHPNLK